MATGPGVNQGKTAFLEEFLPGNRDASQESINEAWRAAGHEGEVSESLVSKTRSRLKIAKKRAAKGRSEAGRKAASKAKSSTKGAEPKRAATAGEAPSQPSRRDGGTGPSRSSFVEELLRREPGANVAAVNRAWSEAGHEGKISDSVFFKIKRELGTTGERSTGGSASAGSSEPEASVAGSTSDGRGDASQRPSGRDRATANSTGAAGASFGDHDRLVDEVEAGIDDLMFALKSGGGMPEVEAALRAARRLLTRRAGSGE
jgi:hypothetical protein